MRIRKAKKIVCIVVNQATRRETIESIYLLKKC